MSEVDIHGLSVHGEGIGRLADGRVVFVPRALPGDRVRIALTQSRKRVQYADLVDVVAASAHRVGSRCGIESCGGCPLRALSRSMQARLKRQTVVEAMRRIGGLDVQSLLGDVMQFGDGWSNRHRVRLHTAYENGRWQFGYYERRSKNLVPLASCPVAWPEVERLGLALGRALAHLPPEACLVDVDVAFSRRDARGSAKITTCGSLSVLRDALEWIEQSELSGVEVEAADGRWRHGNLELRYDHRRAEDFDLRFEPGLFTQPYPEANDCLVDAVVAAIRPREAPKLVELHAGIGNFSVPLARSGARVQAFEKNRRAAILCRRNGRGPGMEMEVYAQSDEDALPALREADVVLLDPPRTGARVVADALARHPVPRVVYVSCDPATLARDVAALLAGGYTLEHIEAFDMFPQSTHVETMVVLSHP